MKLVYRWAALVCCGILVGACTQIPELDQVWVEEKLLFGMSKEDVEGLLAGRSLKLGSYGYNPGESPSVGFVRVEAKAPSEPECYARSYTVLVGSGDRLICVVVGENDELIWREAGWFGAVL